MKRFFLFIVFSFFGVTFVLFAQNNNVYPRIEKNGVEYYEYVVRQGEGLWSISQRFGISQADLHKNNPEINTSGGLKVGQKLVIPIKKNVEDSSLMKEESGVSYLTHVVERKQTLFAISKLYDVKIDDLISCNKLQGSEIKEGQSLLIPRKTVVVRESVKESDTITFIEHEVKRKETLFSISRQYGVDINDITQYNEIRESLPRGMILKIPQKRAIEKTLVDTLAVKEKEEPLQEKKVSSSPIKVGILLPFRLSDKKTDKFLDFYKGCLLALNNAKKRGVSSEILTYDTENSKETVFEILKDEKLKEVDLIIGPAYAEIIPLVSEFAVNNQIYTVIPFSSSVDDIYKNPYLIQVNPTQKMLMDLVVSDLVKKNRSKLFVLGKVSAAEKDKGRLFAENLEKELVKNHVPYESVDIETANIDSVLELTTNVSTLFLLASEDKNKVAPYIKILSARKPKNLEIIGFEKWGIDLFLGTTLPICYSSLFMDKKTLATDAYNSQFLSQFGTPVSSDIPRYDMLGFDIMQYMLRMLLIDRENPTNGFAIHVTDCVQSEFKFVQVENGGWVNQNFYIHNNVK